MDHRGAFAIEIHQNGDAMRTTCGEGESLLEAVEKTRAFSLPAPCGGRGRCGKCRIHIQTGQCSPPEAAESRILGLPEIESGTRLACLARPLSDCVVHIPPRRSGPQDNRKHQAPVAFEPWVRKLVCRTAPASLEDQRGELERLAAATESVLRADIHLLRTLPQAVKAGGGLLTLAIERFAEERLVAIEPGDTGSRCFGAAVDIGTTTVAVYLVDLISGIAMESASALNAQEIFGADVISRINHAMSTADGLEQLRARVCAQIDALLHEVCGQSAVSRGELYAVVLVGNTTMLHLAAGIDARAIAAAPFIPVLTSAFSMRASDFGIQAAACAMVHCLPSVSAYVGADIVAAVLASGMAEREELSLLVDIGTNGEIVLGNADGLLSCSTAAGPAFEGAHIRCGVGGVPGAVDSVRFEDGRPRLTSIAGAPPVGICGSGLVDAIHELLGCGLIDGTGRMMDGREAASAAKDGRLHASLAGRMIELDGEPAFRLSGEIVVTQKDVREVQLAKAAIAAGIHTLLADAGRSFAEVRRLYLAGGFGSALHPRSACGLGLLPTAPGERIVVLGNAAGAGAVMCLTDARSRRRAQGIRALMRSVELSSTPRFQEAYIERMGFP